MLLVRRGAREKAVGEGSSRVGSGAYCWPPPRVASVVRAFAASNVVAAVVAVGAEAPGSWLSSESMLVMVVRACAGGGVSSGVRGRCHGMTRPMGVGGEEKQQKATRQRAEAKVQRWRRAHANRRLWLQNGAPSESCRLGAQKKRASQQASLPVVTDYSLLLCSSIRPSRWPMALAAACNSMQCTFPVPTCIGGAGLELPSSFSDP